MSEPRRRIRWMVPLVGALVVGVGVALIVAPRAEASRLDLPAAGEAVYVLGDSWSTGYSADPGKGYLDLVAASTGWVLTVNAQSGTGYTANLAGDGQVFGERVSDLPAELPSLIIVQGGLNDEWGSPGLVAESATAVTTSLHERYPDVAVVLVGPSTARWPVSDTLWSIDAQLKETARANSAWYVSPLDGAWFAEDNISTAIDPDTRHPSNEGHELFAEELVSALRDQS